MLRVALAVLRHVVPHNAKGYPRFENQVQSCDDCDSQWVAEFCSLTGYLEWRKIA